VLHVISLFGRAMGQAVSRRRLTAEDRVRVRVKPCGICGGQSGTGTGVVVLPCQYYSNMAVRIHIGLVTWGMKNTPVGRSSETLYHPIEMNMNVVCYAMRVTRPAISAVQESGTTPLLCHLRTGMTICLSTSLCD
jgi:hypothetical protein